MWKSRQSCEYDQAEGKYTRRETRVFGVGPDDVKNLYVLRKRKRKVVEENSRNIAPFDRGKAEVGGGSRPRRVVRILGMCGSNVGALLVPRTLKSQTLADANTNMGLMGNVRMSLRYFRPDVSGATLGGFQSEQLWLPNNGTGRKSTSQEQAQWYAQPEE